MRAVAILRGIVRRGGPCLVALVPACSSQPPIVNLGAPPEARVSLLGGDADAAAPPRDANARREPSATPGVRYVGRYDTRDPSGPWAAWPGTRVVVSFEGTSLTATTNQGTTFFGPSRYDVIVDGVLQPSHWVVTNGVNDKVLATGLAPGAHVVELWRRTAGFAGPTQFKSFGFGGGKLLPPPAPKARRLEFVGDSSINGYGIECTNASEGFTAQTQNEHKAYPALVAIALDADHSNVSFSGKGVLRNANDADPETFASLYVRAMPEDKDSIWSFASFVPDLVFVALGGNDFTNGNNRPPPPLGEFKAKYHELIALVRSKNPGAQIVCSVEGRMTNKEPAGYNALTSMTTAIRTVVGERNASGDPKVHYYELPRADGSGPNGAPDLTGCDRHTNVGFHQKAAVATTAKLKAILGW